MISKKVFIASDGFVAFIDRAHRNHVHTTAFFRYFAQEHFQLYTTIVAINDTYTQLYNTISPSIARDLLRAMYISNINIISPEAADIKAAINTVSNSSSVELTFSRALTSNVCNRRNIPQVCTFEYFPTLFGLQVFYLPV